MPLGNWEGWINDEAEPEELPDLNAGDVLRMTGRRNIEKRAFSVVMCRKGFFIFNQAFNFSW